MPLPAQKDMMQASSYLFLMNSHDAGPPGGFSFWWAGRERLYENSLFQIKEPRLVPRCEDRARLFCVFFHHGPL